MANAAFVSTLWGDPNDPNFARDYLVPIQVLVYNEATKSSDDLSLLVHKLAASYFQAFVDELAHIYLIKDISSWVNRNIRGSTTHKSQHSWGNAIDINPSTNPSTTTGIKITDMPVNISQLAAKHHLIWGGDWHMPIDPMHMEFNGYGVNK